MAASRLTNVTEGLQVIKFNPRRQSGRLFLPLRPSFRKTANNVFSAIAYHSEGPMRDMNSNLRRSIMCKASPDEQVDGEGGGGSSDTTARSPSLNLTAVSGSQHGCAPARPG